MSKIKMVNPIAELDGDEMTRILWRLIKDKLLLPFVTLNTEYYDLGLMHRDETGDQVTIEAANAIKRLGIGVKCATITPNKQRMEEYRLREMWSSPNATLRAMLDGTVFRAPVVVPNIQPSVRTWKKPITIARHAYGDVYKGVEARVDCGEAFLSIGDSKIKIHDFIPSPQSTLQGENSGAGIVQAVHNTDASIMSFARASFEYALSVKQDLWFATKDTISKIYDHRFKDIFQEIYDAEYKERFAKAGINYWYMLIDDAVARVIRSEGGFVWALKNYDGDVMSDMISAAFGSLAMMTSVLVSPFGQFEYEAAHGTVTRHYYKYLNGETTSTNPIATIFAWTGALRKRGELDGSSELVAFACKLEAVCLKTIEDGYMTGDLAGLAVNDVKRVLSTEGFLDEVAGRMQG
ncbi:MAG: NADP-dependent isocitrate dehydrogenase [Oscillospiraceae bacterium]|jgi:isocitrate dehydrogenase|nr:NADP-dependent isocitrate dehydrogenase [Oscillospiraceae bacterium]